MSSIWVSIVRSRLRNERRGLEHLPKEILSLSPIDESTDLKHWEAKIRGSADTPYENGVFELDIQLPDNYPAVPPKIKFKTKVFHPNISSKGEICLDILQDEWAQALILEKTLLSIYLLLLNPNIDDFIVPEAAYLYKENRKEYDRKAREWTNKYAMTNNDSSEVQQNSNELKDLVDTITTINITSSLSDHIIQEAVVIESNSGRRPARFNVVEPLQQKTFDNGESKEYLPIVAECLRSSFSHQQRHSVNSLGRHQINHFSDDIANFQPDSLDFFRRNRIHYFNDTTSEPNINSELQSLAMALEIEGMKLGKRPQSEILANELRTLIGKTFDEVGQGCLRLYSMETFLYPQLNQFLREADNTKIETYGSFVRLLWYYFNDSSSTEVHSIEVYRGMNLLSEMIDAYKKATISEISFRWAGFSSTSRNRDFVENFYGDTLFIMQLRKIYSKEKKAIDITGYSQFPNEEEVLLKSGVEFTVEKVEYNDEKKKHYIYLNVFV